MTSFALAFYGGIPPRDPRAGARHPLRRRKTYTAAWNNLEHVNNLVTVATGGTGFRYEMARKYGLHAGVDVAWGPDGSAIYFQFGSAWARP